MVKKRLEIGLRVAAWSVFISSVLSLGGFASANDALLQSHCMGCHVPEQMNPMKLSRISHQRKTPEGWLMTVARMQVVHGLKITHENRRALVKYLADTQGLAPQEASPYRYVLERRLNHVEEKQPELAEMCARCHSQARIGLQRREENEWQHLVHFHLGQWPSIEYSAMGRDRDWLGIALKEVVPFLGKNYGLQSESWAQWQQKKPKSVEGRWRLVGNMPGRGDFQGEMVLTSTSKDFYSVALNGSFGNGDPLKGVGKAIIYSGYEWRADVTLGEERFQQVLALNPEGDELSGRMFLKRQETLGVNLQAVRDSETQLMAISPSYIRAGEDRVISLRGSNLTGDISFGKGIELLSVVSRSSDEIKVGVRAADFKQATSIPVAVGEQELTDGFTVYNRVGRLEVSPGFAVARVGEGGGSAGKVKAAFQAKAYAPGADGLSGTVDDILIGVMPASWSLAPFDAKAVEDKDLAFAGHIDGESGVFTPSEAGPNPERKYGTNNAGHLNVVATVEEGGQSLQAKAELLVTVQRWNNPPIR